MKINQITEGKYKCSCRPGDADPDCPVHGLEPMDVGDALDVKEGLNEFAPPGSGDSGDDGFSEETLKRLAAQWYNGDEDPRIEKTLMAAGWEIGQDEGYDDEPGVFVVQAGDINGNSYLSWPAHELKQGMAEGGDAFMPGIQNTPEYKAGFETGKLPVPHPEGTQEYANYYKGVIDKATPNLQKTAEGNDKVGNMDADKFDAAMDRLKKLAGMGPLKTVYDPQKRVYKNVPTAVQPKKEQ